MHGYTAYFLGSFKIRMHWEVERLSVINKQFIIFITYKWAPKVNVFFQWHTFLAYCYLML